MGPRGLEVTGASVPSCLFGENHLSLLLFCAVELLADIRQAQESKLQGVGGWPFHWKWPGRAESKGKKQEGTRGTDLNRAISLTSNGDQGQWLHKALRVGGS